MAALLGRVRGLRSIVRHHKVPLTLRFCPADLSREHSTSVASAAGNTLHAFVCSHTMHV